MNFKKYILITLKFLDNSYLRRNKNNLTLSSRELGIELEKVTIDFRS